jgi:flavin-dependent thymidylate synthase
VWHDPSRSCDPSNLVSLCVRCHTRVHRWNLELSLLEAVSSAAPLSEFWTRHAGACERPIAKTLPEPRRLWRTFSRVERIEFAGEEETYDVAVGGPFRNFVANGFIVHNSVNEYSGRYSILDREFYLPPADSLGVQSTGNRQGRGARLDAARAAAVLQLLKDDATRCYDHYQELLNEDDAGRPLRPGESSLARELARINLTLGFYTQWYWKIDLHNLLQFLLLRGDAHAQEEIRAYARAIGDVARRWVPLAWEAFVDYRLEAMTLSRGEREAVRHLLAGERPDLASLGLSKREQDELRAKLGPHGER